VIYFDQLSQVGRAHASAGLSQFHRFGGLFRTTKRHCWPALFMIDAGQYFRILAKLFD
jgi:hypothetical protein